MTEDGADRRSIACFKEVYKNISYGRGLNTEFVQMDALTLPDFNRQFDAVIDSGLFHIFNAENWARYVAGLTHVIQPGERLFLLCFSDQEASTQGSWQVSKLEIQKAFVDDLEVEQIRVSRLEIRSDLEDISFSEAGPKAWFSVIRRVG